MLSLLEEFIGIVEEIKHISESEVDWKTKYDLIFSSHFNGRIKATGIPINYYDPDRDYEDDVLAYVRALDEKAEVLKGLL